jgi:pyrroloquinoline quinone biosynthesis protein D
MNDPTSMALDSCLQLSRLYRLQWEEVQRSWVLLYPEGMVKLNGSAGEILQRLDGQTSVGQLIERLQQDFGASDVSQDVLDFLGHAQRQGWIHPALL